MVEQELSGSISSLHDAAFAFSVVVEMQAFSLVGSTCPSVMELGNWADSVVLCKSTSASHDTRPRLDFGPLSFVSFPRAVKLTTLTLQKHTHAHTCNINQHYQTKTDTPRHKNVGIKFLGKLHHLHLLSLYVLHATLRVVRVRCGSQPFPPRSRNTNMGAWGLGLGACGITKPGVWWGRGGGVIRARLFCGYG